MAKGQKRSTREIRKPKQDKAKPGAAQRSFLQPPNPPKSTSSSGKSGGG